MEAMGRIEDVVAFGWHLVKAMRSTNEKEIAASPMCSRCVLDINGKPEQT